MCSMHDKSALGLEKKVQFPCICAEFRLGRYDSLWGHLVPFVQLDEDSEIPESDALPVELLLKVLFSR